MEFLRRVGRNDPCPCGSGRKYKACCLRRDDAFEVARRGTEGLTGILIRAIRVEEVWGSAEGLWARYWPDGPPPRSLDAALRAATETGDVDPTDPDALDIYPFISWLVYGAQLEGPRTATAAPDPGGPPRTLLDLAIGTETVEPESPAGQLVDAFRRTVESAFQVLRLQPGRRVWLRDVFTDEVFEVGDRDLPQQAVPGEVLITRLLPLDGLYALTSACWRFPAAEVRALRPWAEMELSRRREFQPDAGWRDLWREGGHLLHHYAVRARRHPRLPEMRTTTGEPVVLCRLEWRVRDAAAVFAALDARGQDLRRDGDEPFWTWLPAPGDRRWVRRGPDGALEGPGAALLPGGPSLGQIALREAENVLTLETMSAERAVAGRALVEAVAGAHLRFRGQTRRSPSDVLASSGPDPEAADSVAAAGAGDIPAEALREAAEGLIRDYERRWCDMTIPALDGKTPRQAAASADPLLRRRLDDLLLEMAQVEARAVKSATGGAGMSVARLRDLLGWPERSAGR